MFTACESTQEVERPNNSYRKKSLKFTVLSPESYWKSAVSSIDHVSLNYLNILNLVSYWQKVWQKGHVFYYMSLCHWASSSGRFDCFQCLCFQSQEVQNYKLTLKTQAISYFGTAENYLHNDTLSNTKDLNLQNQRCGKLTSVKHILL